MIPGSMSGQSPVTRTTVVAPAVASGSVVAVEHVVLAATEHRDSCGGTPVGEWIVVRRVGNGQHDVVDGLRSGDPREHVSDHRFVEGDLQHLPREADRAQSCLDYGDDSLVHCGSPVRGHRASARVGPQSNHQIGETVGVERPREGFVVIEESSVQLGPVLYTLERVGTHGVARPGLVRGSSRRSRASRRDLPSRWWRHPGEGRTHQSSRETLRCASPVGVLQLGSRRIGSPCSWNTGTPSAQTRLGSTSVEQSITWSLDWRANSGAN